MSIFFVSNDDDMDAKTKSIQSRATNTEDWTTATEFHDKDDDLVDIPGLRNLRDSKYTLIGKLIWLVILTACSMTVFIQVANRVQHYLSSPVSVGIQIRSNATMYYPDVTVCHTEFWRKDLYDDVKREIANLTEGAVPSNVNISDILQHMTIMELWERVAFRLEDLILTCTVENEQCIFTGKWEQVNTVLGICYTFKMDYPVNVSGNTYGIKLALNTTAKTTAFKILTHTREDTPKSKVFTEGISVSTYFITDIRLKLRQFRLKATNSRPCGDMKISSCKVKCLSDYTLNMYNCRLPFMDDVSVPYCAPPYHSIAVTAVNNILLGKGSGCTCMPECSNDRFESSIDSTYSPSLNLTKVRIYYENFDFTIITEDFSYGFTALMSDIGGTLGLFLGFSLLTFVEITAALLVRLKRSVQKKRVFKPSQEFTSSRHNNLDSHDDSQDNNNKY